MLEGRTLLKMCLGKLGLAPQREEEILRELGDHLEDHAALLEAGGVMPEEAVRKALSTVSDWPAFRNDILSAEAEEGDMHYRTKVLWLPALCTFFLSAGLLALLQTCYHWQIYWLSGVPLYFPWILRSGKLVAFPVGAPIFVPWLLVLPLVGAVAALWSKWAGGRVAHRLLAALTPICIWLGYLLVVLVLATAFGRPHRIHLLSAWFATYLLNWVLLPSLALLMGTTPFLRKTQSQS